MSALSLPATVSFVLPAGQKLYLARPTKQLVRYLFAAADTDREFLLTPASLNGRAWVIFPKSEGHGLPLNDAGGGESLEKYFGDSVIDSLKGRSRGGIEGDLFLGG